MRSCLVSLIWSISNRRKLKLGFRWTSISPPSSGRSRTCCGGDASRSDYGKVIFAFHRVTVSIACLSRPGGGADGAGRQAKGRAQSPSRSSCLSRSGFLQRPSSTCESLSATRTACGASDGLCAGFSANIRDIFERYGFSVQIDRLRLEIQPTLSGHREVRQHRSPRASSTIPDGPCLRGVDPQSSPNSPTRRPESTSRRARSSA